MIIFICRKLCVKQTRIQVFSDSYFPVNVSSYFTQRIGWHEPNYNYTFFISNTFISNTRLKLAKNQAKAKQHSETELSLFENYSLSLFTLSFENNRYSKKCTKNKCAYFNNVNNP